MKVIIAGSRTINDIKKVENAIFISGFKVTEVVSGNAKGVDRLGEEWSKNNGISIKKFPANWEKYGKSAGYIRNVEMAKYVGNKGGLIAVWGGLIEDKYILCR